MQQQLWCRGLSRSSALAQVQHAAPWPPRRAIHAFACASGLRSHGPQLQPRSIHAAAAAAAADGLPGPHESAAAGLQLPGATPAGGVWASTQAAVRSTYNKAKAALVSDYDAELFALALPALASMLLDPIMNVISACELL